MFGTVKNKCGLVRERETLKSNPDAYSLLY